MTHLRNRVERLRCPFCFIIHEIANAVLIQVNRIRSRTKSRTQQANVSNSPQARLEAIDSLCPCAFLLCLYVLPPCGHNRDTGTAKPSQRRARPIRIRRQHTAVSKLLLLVFTYNHCRHLQSAMELDRSRREAHAALVGDVSARGCQC